MPIFVLLVKYDFNFLKLFFLEKFSLKRKVFFSCSEKVKNILVGRREIKSVANLAEKHSDVMAVCVCLFVTGEKKE